MYDGVSLLHLVLSPNPYTHGILVCHSGWVSVIDSGDTTKQTACLTKHSYDEAKCQQQIDALYQCCAAFYTAMGDDARTAACPKPSLLRLKLEQQQQQQQKK